MLMLSSSVPLLLISLLARPDRQIFGIQGWRFGNGNERVEGKRWVGKEENFHQPLLVL
jgi:hypothetical protein